MSHTTTTISKELRPQPIKIKIKKSWYVANGNGPSLPARIRENWRAKRKL